MKRFTLLTLLALGWILYPGEAIAKDGKLPNCDLPIAATCQQSRTGYLAWGTDGLTSADCLTGGGSTRVLCQFNGSAWAVANSGSSGTGSGDFTITDTSPALGYEDTDATDGDTNATAAVGCDTVTSGAEDCNYTVSVQEAGALTNKFQIDADGDVDVLDSLGVQATATAGDDTTNINIRDVDATDGDVNALIATNCTDASTGAEDCDFTISVQEAGALAAKIAVDADGDIQFSDSIEVTATATGGDDTTNINITDIDATDQDISAIIATNCTDNSTGAEDCDVTVSAQVAGAMTAIIAIDTDDALTPSTELELTPDYVTFPDGAVGRPGITFAGDTDKDTGIFLTAEDQLSLAVNGNQELSINTAAIFANSSTGYYIDLGPCSSTSPMYASATASTNSGMCINSDIVHFVSDGVAAGSWDATGNLDFAVQPVQSHHYDATEINADAAQCTATAQAAINSGPIVDTFTCTDNDASILYGHLTMPNNWDAGTILFSRRGINVNATPDGNVVSFDFSAMCRADGGIIDATWGTEVPGAITFDGAQFDIETVVTTAVTPDNTPTGCAAGSTVFWRASWNASDSTTTQPSDVRVLDMKMLFDITTMTE